MIKVYMGEPKKSVSEDGFQLRMKTLLTIVDTIFVSLQLWLITIAACV